MRKLSPHAEWLSLVEVSGPFLTTSVLEEKFPQGLEIIDTHLKQRLRSAYDEWRDAVDDNDSQLAELHLAWNQLVLRELFEFEYSVLFPIHDNDDLTFKSLDSEVRFVPDFALRSDDTEKPMLLISVLKDGADLEKVKTGDEWPVSIHERMVLLCRAKGIRFGLITNGEQWMLIDAPIGSTSSSVSWYAHLWFQEEMTLRALQSLLGVRRWFGPKEQSLAAMLDESLKHHEEVTDTLGEQVRRAVEVLVQSLDKADQDRNRELLENVLPTELYEAGLTVMMRLVFVLCAEERGLLLLGDPIYDQYYAITTLRAQLVEESDRHGHEVLERRHDGWARLLAIFRFIYSGVEHETLRMPALGGSLFDPDRFSFLEGRAKGTSWKDIPAQPLPIDNRTVLLLLEALQVLEQSGGALLLSYKALDVEQIGHVYEGLLEYTVQRMTKDTLGLLGSQKVKFPNITLAELESALVKGQDAFILKFKETTGRSDSAIQNAIKKKADEDRFGKILLACGGDMALANRIRPFALLMRKDAWDDFIIYRAGSFAVTLGTDRRETGTHYTPKYLAESIVETTLEPIVYIGPANGKPREEWLLKSSSELLDLKICDPAMGSGAFLVQVCRWLSERLVEAWGKEESKGKFISVDGDALNYAGDKEPMPSSLDERLLIARRLIAERCLYGVDMNPLAVELAKLSIWLITLAKGRPFGFLDHNLRSGDSLLGLHKLEQLTRFSLNPEKKQAKSLFASSINAIVKDVIALRKKLRKIRIMDIRDVQYMERLDKESRQKLTHIEYIADAMIGEALTFCGNENALEVSIDVLSTLAKEYIDGSDEAGWEIIVKAKKALSIDLPDGKPLRNPFHWPLEFPEVFEQGGFDVIVGNPPFLGNKKISGTLGPAYREFVVTYIANGKAGLADLCAYFLLRYQSLVCSEKFIGIIATDKLAQGDTAKIGLGQLYDSITIYNATQSIVWPGAANVFISIVFIVNTNDWNGMVKLNDKYVSRISPLLVDQSYNTGFPKKLKRSEGLGFNGSVILGDGFILDKQEVDRLIDYSPSNKDVIKPYLGGEDLNQRPGSKPSRYVICFWDWPLSRSELQNDEDLIVAEDYPQCLSIIEERVKPERDLNKKKPYREKWWNFAELSKGAYERTGNGEFVLIKAQVSPYHSLTFVERDAIFSQQTVVFKGYMFDFCVLQSSIHEAWAIQYSTSKGASTIVYSVSSCLVTFPFPLAQNEENISEAGKNYFEFRKSSMSQFGIGMTALSNRFHNPKEMSSEIKHLRELHIKMDNAVASAYGWEKLAFGHGFYETKQGIRFTISEAGRREVLQRLLKLNHERHDEEIQLGLHDKKKKLNTPFKKRNSTKKSNTNLDLFEN